jgi:hypothetical protein
VKAGKALKAFSLLTSNAGISYVALRKLDTRSMEMAEVIGQKHKYIQKRDRWYVVAGQVHSRRLVDWVLPILSKWEKSDALERLSVEMDKIMPTTHIRMGKSTQPMENTDDTTGNRRDHTPK